MKGGGRGDVKGGGGRGVREKGLGEGVQKGKGQGGSPCELRLHFFSAWLYFSAFIFPSLSFLRMYEFHMNNSS